MSFLLVIVVFWSFILSSDPLPTTQSIIDECEYLLEDKEIKSLEASLDTYESLYKDHKAWDSLPPLLYYRVACFENGQDSSIVEDKIQIWITTNFASDTVLIAEAYNEVSDYYLDHFNTGSAEKYGQKAYKIAQQALPPEHKDRALTTAKLANIFHKKGDAATMIKYYTEAHDISLNCTTLMPTERAMIELGYGTSYAYRGLLDSAIIVYKNALTIVEEPPHSLTSDEFKGILLGNIGIMYGWQGEMFREIDYSKEGMNALYKALALNKNHPKNKKSIQKRFFTNSLNLAATYYAIGDSKKALTIQTNILDEMAEALGKDNQTYQSALLHPIQLYLGEGQKEKALSLLNQIQIQYLENPFYLSQYYLSLAEYYTVSEQCDSTRIYASKALESLQKVGSVRNDMVYPLIVLSDCYKNAGDLESQLSTIDEMERMLPVEDDKHIYKTLFDISRADAYNSQGMFRKARSYLEKARDLIDVEENNFPEKQWILDYYYQRAYYLYYSPSSDLEMKKQAIKDLQTALDYCKKLNKLESNYNLAGLDFDEELQNYHDLGSEILIHLHDQTNDKTYLNQLFVFLDQFNLMEINDKLNKLNSLQFAEAPPSVIKREQYLLSKISESNYSSEVDTKDYLDALEEYDSFLDSLHKNYPKYYDFRYQNLKVNLQETRSNILKDKQNLLRYFSNDKGHFVLLLTPDSLSVFELGTLDLDTAIENLKEAARKQNSRLYKQEAFRLYKDLFYPIRTHLTSSDLVIVPEGDLYRLNWEMLISSESGDDFKEFNYLLKDYSIVYLYSLDVYNQKLNLEEEKNPVSIVTFAPGDFEDDISSDEMLVNQPFAVQYSKKLARRLGGRAFLRKKATEYNFVKESKNSRILHLATHTFFDTNPFFSRVFLHHDDNPETVTDGQLHVYEIYDLTLNSDLAFLLSCESGVGKDVASKGLISLAYSFLYAGCSATISSLWKIDEKESQKIADLFYKNLEDHTIKESLRLAKLDYLNDSKGDLSSPYYWAGFLPQGLMDKQIETKSYTPYWIYIVCLTVLITIYFLWKK